MVDAGTGKLAVSEDATHAESEAFMTDHMWARTSAAKTGLNAVEAELTGATLSGVPTEVLLEAWKQSQSKPVPEKQWLAIQEGRRTITPFRLEKPINVADIAVNDGVFRRGTATADDDTTIDLARAVPQGGVIKQGRLLSGRVSDVGGGVVHQATLDDCSASELNVSMNLPWWSLGFHTLFMVCVIGTVLLGVQRGIEVAAKILMPLLLLLLVALILRGVTLEGAGAGIQFFLSPDFGKLTAAGVLMALGHAFFSLSLGMGAMITYGSYVDREQNVFLSSLSIVVLDTIIALLAGLAIFPAVFAKGFAPDAGPALIFQLIPQVFAEIPLGFAWCMAFFLLLSVAALTSGISLQEVVTAYFIDERGWSRKRATLVFGSVIWFLGCLSAVSFYGWGRLLWLKHALQSVFGAVPSSFFAVMDNLASNWMLPLGGFFISLFVGWIWGTRKAVVEIRHGSENFADVHLVALLSGLKDDESHNSPDHVWTLASVWGIFIRFLSPLAILIAFLYTIGWLKL
ncbi:MAG: sodium-dependent transporter [bacterium]